MLGCKNHCLLMLRDTQRVGDYQCTRKRDVDGEEQETNLRRFSTSQVFYNFALICSKCMSKVTVVFFILCLQMSGVTNLKSVPRQAGAAEGSSSQSGAAASETLDSIKERYAAA